MMTPEKRQIFGKGSGPEHFLTPQYVAEHIIKLVENRGNQFPGGAIYDVPLGMEPRIVPMWGAKPNPQMETFAKLSEMADGIVPGSFQHIKEMFDQERGNKWP